MECTHQFEFESECVFTCAAGYRRVGPEKVVCTRKKFWNPAELPACGKHLVEQKSMDKYHTL